MVRILVDAPAAGQFIQRVPLPLGTPTILTGNQAWVRKMADLPGSQIHVIEAWGESTAISNGVLTVTPGIDVPALPHASMVGLPAACALATCTMAGLEVERYSVVSESKIYGRVVTIQFRNALWRVDVEVIAHWRSPWALVDGCVRIRYKTADRYITSGVLTIPGYGQFELGGDVLGIIVPFRGITTSGRPGDLAIPMPAPGVRIDYPRDYALPQPRSSYSVEPPIGGPRPDPRRWPPRGVDPGHRDIPNPRPDRPFDPDIDYDDPEFFSLRMVRTGRRKTQSITAGSVSKRSGWTGAGSDRLTEELTSTAPQNPGVMLAVENSQKIFSRAVPETWEARDWMFSPKFASPFSRLYSSRAAPAVRSRQNPNAAGVDGGFGHSTYALIWCSDGARRASADEIGEAAAQHYMRQSTLLGQDGETIARYPARAPRWAAGVPWLSRFDGMPYISINNEPYDDLGHNIPIGGRWPLNAGEMGSHNSQHESVLTSASEAATMGFKVTRIFMEAKGRSIGYERAMGFGIGGFPASMGGGRGFGRTLLSLCAAAAVDWDARSAVDSIGVPWCVVTHGRMIASGIPRSAPCHLASGVSFPDYLNGSYGGYEEGLCAMSYLQVWRITGNREALECAYRVGRLIATTIFLTGTYPNEEIRVGLFIHWRGDGQVQQEGQGLIVYAGPALRIWSVAGLNAYLGAWEAMRTLGIAGESIDTFWLAHARRCREILTAVDLNEHVPGEAVAFVNQTLWNVDPVALGRRI